jgi:hypothetical protein
VAATSGIWSSRPRHLKEGYAMSALDWVLSTLFVVMYVFLLFTVCFLTFRKGHILLGILGIFIPFLWLIGAILPARRGSRYEVDEAMRYQAQMNQMTS